MSEIDTSPEAIAALADALPDSQWQSANLHAARKVLLGLAAERDELLQALRTADSYLDKGLDQIARNVTRTAILKHGGANG